MASATDAGASNGALQRWEEMYSREAKLVKERAEAFAAEIHSHVGGEQPSTDVSQEPSSSQVSASAEAGTSSLTSESTQDKSGSSLPASESSLPSPAPTAESLSEAAQAAPQAPSSTASSTDGSTQETGASQAGQPDSSEASQAKTEPTQAPIDFAAAAEALVDDARKAYNDKDYNLAADLINRAEALYPAIKATTGAAHDAINAALAATTATQQP